MKKYFPILRRKPRPGAPFDYDYFLRLMLWRKEGFTTEAENEYIDKELLRNDEALKLFEDMEITFPDSRDFPRSAAIKRRRSLATAAVVMLLLIAVGLYAVRHWRIVPVEKEKTYQYQQPLHEIADSIEKNYRIKVFFDRPEIANYHFSGYAIDTTKPLGKFLENLNISSGITFYFDEDNNLHFCSK